MHLDGSSYLNSGRFFFYEVESSVAYSDDYAPTFSGDNSGDLFDAPDVVRESPTTTERVVDTQSGFLVVIKRLDARLSLSVKRRLGTPPSSSILLTPDESLKLSRILGSRFETRTSAARAKSSVDLNTDTWSERHDADAQRIPLEDKDELSHLDVSDRHARPVRARRPRQVHKISTGSLQLPSKSVLIGVICAVLLPLLVICVLLGTAKQPAKTAVTAAPAVVDVEAIETERVNKFARTFVSDMLDFSPATYRLSQIHAMANMSPELLNSYWNETHFPLTPEQLKLSPQGMTLMITKVEQKRLDELTRDVDVFAELVSANNKLSNPVHLHLKIESGTDGQLRVLEQKDLSATK